jgi:hypothetical protein
MMDCPTQQSIVLCFSSQDVTMTKLFHARIALAKLITMEQQQHLPMITTSHVGLLLIAKSNDNNVAIYNDHLFFPPIALTTPSK